MENSVLSPGAKGYEPVVHGDMTYSKRRNAAIITKIFNAFRNRKASVSADQSFAMHGVLQQLGLNLPMVDYNKTLGQVYQELFTSILAWNSTVTSPLAMAAGSLWKDVPSWVPNLELEQLKSGMMDYFFVDSRLCNGVYNKRRFLYHYTSLRKHARHHFICDSEGAVPRKASLPSFKDRLPPLGNHDTFHWCKYIGEDRKLFATVDRYVGSASRLQDFPEGDVIAKIPGLGTALVLREVNHPEYNVAGHEFIPGFVEARGETGTEPVRRTEEDYEQLH
ncbi:hypothetical protein K458DRAFT_397907 [Lentithecium fluviatile CBS 122367]|uniref:Uncharacterized protein n=1 Tax=Lentithecium fluviatile CBS 122367 TaxID=1168545 RepID=A0A6G1JLI9_9PLEO|nr:hypothetical protein K458DRAFT_397907 [Lentithecium fluviatile CBS 122367]